MESSILDQLTKRGRISYMELRAFFPLDTKFKLSYNNLLRLKLIEERKGDNETLVDLTEDGMEAYFAGLNKWIRKKVLDKIESGQFVMTKELTSLEVNAARRMEQEGAIFQSGRFRFSISPSYKPETTIEPKKEKKSLSSKRSPLPWHDIFGFGGWAILAILAFLGIIEYEFGYVAKMWGWFIQLF